jgi:EAL and modified HD-GYP domain-containing signal transduction protein
LSQLLDNYVAHQPVLDVRQRTIGYELLFRDSLDADNPEYDEEERSISEAIVSGLGSLAEDEDMNRTLGFVKISHRFLHSDLATALPTSSSVLLIPPHCPADDDTVERCRKLRRKGVKLCLDDFQRHDRRSALFGGVDFVRIDTRGKKRSEIRQLLRSAGRAKARKIAGNVDTPEAFEQLSGLAFGCFQGYYFARPAMKAQRPSDPGQGVLIKLLVDLLNDADLDEIEQVFKVQVSMGATLLRLVNSSSHSRGVAIGSVKQALVMLGERELRRWVTLLLFAGADRQGMGNPLLELASRRGRCVELMAIRLVDEALGERERREEGDRGFLVGITSLLDVLLGMNYAEVFEQIPIREDLQAAVTDGAGRMGTLLNLQKLLERAEFAQLECELDKLGVKPGEFDAVQREALSWAARLSCGLGA